MARTIALRTSIGHATSTPQPACRGAFRVPREMRIVSASRVRTKARATRAQESSRRFACAAHGSSATRLPARHVIPRARRRAQANRPDRDQPIGWALAQHRSSISHRPIRTLQYPGRSMSTMLGPRLTTDASDSGRHLFLHGRARRPASACSSPASPICAPHSASRTMRDHSRPKRSSCFPITSTQSGRFRRATPAMRRAGLTSRRSFRVRFPLASARAPHACASASEESAAAVLDESDRRREGFGVARRLRAHQSGQTRVYVVCSRMALVELPSLCAGGGSRGDLGGRVGGPSWIGGLKPTLWR